MLTPAPALPLIAPPLPVIETDWFPIADADYVRPVEGRCGYYELQPRDGGPLERRWFNSRTGNWMVVGGREIWKHYTGWRGCNVVQAPHPEPELRPLPAGVPRETKWLQLPLVAPLPTLAELNCKCELPPRLRAGITHYNPDTKIAWDGKGRKPKGIGVIHEVRQIDGAYYSAMDLDNTRLVAHVAGFHTPYLPPGITHYDPVTGRHWDGTGTAPSWFGTRFAPMFAVVLENGVYYSELTGRQVAYLEGAA